MSEKMQRQTNIEPGQEDDRFDFEARNNLVGFYDLLLKIDKRVNPQFYEIKPKYD
jgi:hypothetical protein